MEDQLVAYRAAGGGPVRDMLLAPARRRSRDSVRSGAPLLLLGHEPRCALARGTQGARDRDAPPRRRLELRQAARIPPPTSPTRSVDWPKSPSTRWPRPASASRRAARQEQLEIKMAQRATPARKATPLIAALRGAAGHDLHQPAAHHDIYQSKTWPLSRTLRAVDRHWELRSSLRRPASARSPRASRRPARTMSSSPATRVAPGASPLSSIKSVGAPWELALAEAHQVLFRQGLRNRVRCAPTAACRPGAT